MYLKVLISLVKSTVWTWIVVQVEQVAVNEAHVSALPVEWGQSMTSIVNLY